jgi:protein TonB
MLTKDFESENKSFDNNKRLVGFVVTFVVHAVIILFLVWMVISPPDPPFTDAGGISVNFGSSDVGSGDVQPMTLTPIAADFSAPPPSSAQPAANAPEDIATQDLEDAPVIESKPETKPSPKPDDNSMFKPNAKPTPPNNNKPNNNTAPPGPQVDKGSLFNKGAVGPPNNSKGDGQGGGPGDQGKPNGDPNSKNYEGDGTSNGPGKGPGTGGGVSVSLSGRKSGGVPKPTTCPNVQGKVAIQIKVNRSGKVIETKFLRFESTTFEDCAVNAALEAAKKITFNADPDAPEVQIGTFVVTNKLN